MDPPCSEMAIRPSAKPLTSTKSRTRTTITAAQPRLPGIKTISCTGNGQTTSDRPLRQIQFMPQQRQYLSILLTVDINQYAVRYPQQLKCLLIHYQPTFGKAHQHRVANGRLRAHYWHPLGLELHLTEAPWSKEAPGRVRHCQVRNGVHALRRLYLQVLCLIRGR